MTTTNRITGNNSNPSPIPATPPSGSDGSRMYRAVTSVISNTYVQHSVALAGAITLSVLTGGLVGIVGLGAYATARLALAGTRNNMANNPSPTRSATTRAARSAAVALVHEDDEEEKPALLKPVVASESVLADRRKSEEEREAEIAPLKGNKEAPANQAIESDPYPGMRETISGAFKSLKVKHKSNEISFFSRIYKCYCLCMTYAVIRTLPVDKQKFNNVHYLGKAYSLVGKINMYSAGIGGWIFTILNCGAEAFRKAYKGLVRLKRKVSKT